MNAYAKMPTTTRNVAITGGLGLLGTELVQALRKTACPRTTVRVLLIDALPSSVQHRIINTTQLPSLLREENPHGKNVNTNVFSAGATTPAEERYTRDSAVRLVRGDVASDEIVDALQRFMTESEATSVSDQATVSIFHLASVMSAHGEADFDEAFRVNIDGTRALLKACRRLGCRPRFIFTSSIAALGPGVDLTDETKLLPEITYGMTKAVGELLVNECTRKGFIDGRIARVPTVIVRPGPPNTAATGCFSSVPKAVLHGQQFSCPVSPDLKHPCVGLCTVVDGLLRLHDAPEAYFGKDRAVTLPSVSLTLKELEQRAAELALELGVRPGTIAYERDPVTEAVVRAMPSTVKTSQMARDVGLRPDLGADSILREYVKRQGID